MQDFVDIIHEYLGKRKIDYVLYNTKVPDQNLLERYKKEMERIPVRLDPKRKELPYKVIGASLLAHRPANIAANDPLASSRTLIRHDAAKLANILQAISVIKEVKRYLP